MIPHAVSWEPNPGMDGPGVEICQSRFQGRLTERLDVPILKKKLIWSRMTKDESAEE